MADAVWNDAELLSLATKLRAELNAGHALRLYANGLVPSPSSTRRDFLEATFDGYSAMTLAGLAGPLFLAEVGVYEFDFATLVFSCTGPKGQRVFGWYIDDGVVVKVARMFDVPVDFTNGISLPIALRPQVLDKSLCGP